MITRNTFLHIAYFRMLSEIDVTATKNSSNILFCCESVNCRTTISDDSFTFLFHEVEQLLPPMNISSSPECSNIPLHSTAFLDFACQRHFSYHHGARTSHVYWCGWGHCLVETTILKAFSFSHEATRTPQVFKH